MIRDPRDVVISLASYANRLRRHPHHGRFADDLHTDQDRYRAIIRGFPSERDRAGSVSLAERLQGYAPWLRHPGVLTCRFEDLVGPRGGGSSDAQLCALVELGDHAGVSLSRSHAKVLADRVFSPGAATFHKGTIGQWRERFDEETLAEFDASVSQELMDAYGYRR